MGEGGKGWGVGVVGGLEVGFRWVSSLNHVIKGYVMRR